MMNFSLTPEQQLVQKTAREFARTVLAPRAGVRDRSGQFPAEEIRQLGALGLLGVTVPEEHGGAGAGSVALSLALIEIARADASVAVTMAVTNMVADVTVRFGTAAQSDKWLPPLLAGEAGAFGLSEPQAGSDPAGMTTTAERVADGFVLSGNKQWITSGDRARVLIVWAKIRGSGTISAFLVAGEQAGMVAGRAEDKMGLRGSSTVPLTFEACAISADALLGEEGKGMRVALTALDGGRIGIASQSIGIAEAALAASIDYAKTRVQFGRPIADNQAISAMLAQMAVEVEVARGLVLRAAWRKDQGLPFSKEAAMAKLYASEMAGRACSAAVQIHGGYGYTRDFPVERYFRDVRVTRIYEGTSEIQRIVIARALGQEAGKL